MAPALAAALAAAALAAAGDLRVDAGLRADGRSRRAGIQNAPDLTTVELAASPRLALALDVADLDLAASYAPRFAAPDLTERSRVHVLQVGEASALWRLDPAWRAGLTGAASRGTTDLLTESRRSPGLAPPAIPSTALLRYVGARADGEVRGTLDRRTSLDVAGGWFAAGGEDAVAQAVLPLARGGRGEARLDWRATRRDTLRLRLEARSERLSPSARTGAHAGLTAGWERRLDRALTVSGAAGAIATVEDAPGQRPTRAWLPSAELRAVEDVAAAGLTADAALHLGAEIDPITAAVLPRLEAVTGARWIPAARWALSAHAAGAAVQRAGSHVTRRGAGELRVDRAVGPRTTIGGGVSLNVQRTPGDPSLPSFVEGSAFLALAIDAPPWRP